MIREPPRAGKAVYVVEDRVSTLKDLVRSRLQVRAEKAVFDV
jgi:hypothetical protein